MNYRLRLNPRLMQAIPRSPGIAPILLSGIRFRWEVAEIYRINPYLCIVHYLLLYRYAYQCYRYAPQAMSLDYRPRRRRACAVMTLGQNG